MFAVRRLGEYPEPDGSAHAELPALRSLFFVALDEHDLFVKRMQSFMPLMPGETTSCVGCHEPRTETPLRQPRAMAVLRRAPSRIQPIADAPDVLDFPRDVQSVLNRLCLPCHDCDRHEGGVTFSGDRGPIFSLSYGRNLTHAPRSPRRSPKTHLPCAARRRHRAFRRAVNSSQKPPAL